MGFDVECIIDIHVYPGEYFCPVCHTLVYPNEALQSQCTHLWCKPCLAYIASTSCACPYDGCLVTEADSKPLVISDKALAENIGNVKVRCLYQRSGCTWDGSLSDCTSHCSGCAFGNFPVLCNRCGIQMMHRQVHEHAWSCPGIYEGQQAAHTTQVAPNSGLTAGTGSSHQNQATNQAGPPTSEFQNFHSVPVHLLPGQDSNQQTNANSQAPAAVPSAAPTTEQWYQQYAGNDPNQQAYPQHCAYQQLAVQQYQQHPPQVFWGPQLPVYARAATQVQSQPQVQSQTQIQPQRAVQPHVQQPSPAQPQHVQSQSKNKTQVQPHGAALLHSHVQPLAPQNQNQAQVNPELLLYPPMQSHAQNPLETRSTHGLPASQSQHYNQLQLQSRLQSQPYSVQPQSQHVQANFQQPNLPMLHPQPSQVHLQTQRLTQIQSQPQSQIQPQSHIQPHSWPTQPSQSTDPNAQPQSVISAGYAVSGPLSCLQPLPPQQQTSSAYSASGFLHSGQMQVQALPQPPLMCPLSQGPVPNQQQALFSYQGEAFSMPSAQQQQFHPQIPLLSQPNEQPSVINSSQQAVSQQYVQQQSFSSSVQSQLSHESHLVQQQSQLCPWGPPLMMPQSSNAYFQLQQGVSVTPGVQLQQPQNYVVRPVMPNQGPPTQPQPFAQPSNVFVAGAQSRPAQLGPDQHCTNQNYADKTNNQLQTASDQQLLQSGMTSTSGVLLRHGDNVSGITSVVYEAGLPFQNAAGKVSNTPRVDSVGLNPLKSDTGMTYEQVTTRNSTGKSRKVESVARYAAQGLHGGISGSHQPVGKLTLKEECTGYSVEHSSDVRKQRNIVGDVNPSIPVRPQGSGLLRQPRQSSNPNEQFQSPPLREHDDVLPGGIPVLGSMDSFGKGPAHFGASLGPPLTTVAPGSTDPQRGILGRAPQQGPGGQFGLQHSVTPLEDKMLPNQRQSNFDGRHTKLPGPFERGSFGLCSEVEPNATRTRGLDLDKSSLGSQDKRCKALLGAPPGLTCDAGIRLDPAVGGGTSRVLPQFHPPGGSGIVSLDSDCLIPRSPNKDYLGRSRYSFPEGSRHNLPYPQGNPFQENRFLPLPGHLQRGEQDGPEGLRFGEHKVPGPHEQLRKADPFGQYIPTSHFRRDELFGSGNPSSDYGAFPGHAQMGEPSEPANLTREFHIGEPFAGKKSVLPQLGKPGLSSSFLLHGFPNDVPYAGDMSNFDNSRKRKHVSVGWCRICRVDCETVEGLGMHSQTREHQKMSMDMVMSIKQQNRKKSKASNDRAGAEGGSNREKSCPKGYGKKP